MKPKITGIIIDTTCDIFDEQTIPDGLNSYKQILHADVITWDRVYLGIIPLSVTMDYEMNLKRGKISSRFPDGSTFTRGPIFIAGISKTGVRSLNSMEEDLVDNSVKLSVIKDGKKVYNGYILCGVTKTPNVEFWSD